MNSRLVRESDRNTLSAQSLYKPISDMYEGFSHDLFTRMSFIAIQIINEPTFFCSEHD